MKYSHESLGSYSCVTESLLKAKITVDIAKEALTFGNIVLPSFSKLRGQIKYKILD
jgi:hypothetical protein